MFFVSIAKSDSKISPKTVASIISKPRILYLIIPNIIPGITPRSPSQNHSPLGLKIAFLGKFGARIKLAIITPIVAPISDRNEKEKIFSGT